MTTEPTPEEIRRATFRTVFRGYDAAEVDTFLQKVSQTLEELGEQRSRLAARLGEFADRDLESEFETVGREVASVLQAARTAAETLRDRASADATRWRAEATAEAESIRKAARADAESLRTDAWTTGSQLLDQVRAEVERLRSGAERDSLAVLGEAERESHRLTSGARREAEDLVRTARMEAERLVAQAKSDHDDIIATAHRLAEAAQERTRALEQRREELMSELESVRAALSSFESELEDRRQGLGMSDAPPLPRQVVVADHRGGEPHVETWEEGHTVRVIRPQKPEPAADESEEETPVDEREDVTALDEPEEREPDETAADTEDDWQAEAFDAADRISVADDLEALPPEMPALADEMVAEPEVEAEPVADGPADQEGEQSETPDAVVALFQRLRQPDSAAGVPEEVEAAPGAENSKPIPEPVPATAPPSEAPDDDPFETRERLLLPVTNAALRAVKRALTEAQNDALDKLRLSGGQWEPDAETLGAGFLGDLESLVADAAEAGREAATEFGLGGGPGGEPEPVEVGTLATELAQALQAALAGAGSGARERSAAASRVFRGWRTDEAERRVRWVAMSSYHAALRSALEANDLEWRWLAGGRSCPTCRAAAERGNTLPPAHRDCSCTIVPA